MKKLITALVLLSLAGAGVWAYMTYGVTKVEPQILEATVTRGDITEVVSATGTLEALRIVQVGSQVSGTVSEILVDYNDIVKQGQVIAQIDPSLLQVQVDIQKANIDKQQTDIDSQNVQLEDAKHTLARTKELFAAKLATQQALEQAELTVKTRTAQIASAQKSLFQTQKSLEQAELNVKYCTIISPIDGVVVQRQADKGQTVQASMTTPQFFQLATDLTTLRLTGGVDEADIGKVRPGQTVTFQVDAYKDKTFTGVVDRVRLNATSQQNVVTYQVVSNVANPDLMLRPSMTAQLKIVIETAPNVVKVPNQALRFRPNTEQYTALGVTPPTPGQRPGMPGGGNAGAPPAPAAPGAPAMQTAQNTPGAAPGATPGAGAGMSGRQGGGDPSARTPGQGGQNGQPGQGGQNRTRGTGGRGGTGFGGGAGMTPEQLAALQQQYGRGGAGRTPGAGGGRTGGGGRGGRNAPAANATTGPIVPITQRDASKIDELFTGLERPQSTGTVWTWDPATKQLKPINIRIGITDGQFSELVSGDLQPGTTKLLTGIIVPVTNKPGANPLMGNQPGRGNPGGMTPGGAAPGGGGGGRGGGGGGGRGGN